MTRDPGGSDVPDSKWLQTGRGHWAGPGRPSSTVQQQPSSTGSKTRSSAQWAVADNQASSNPSNPMALNTTTGLNLPPGGPRVNQPSASLTLRKRTQEDTRHSLPGKFSPTPSLPEWKDPVDPRRSTHAGSRVRHWQSGCHSPEWLEDLQAGHRQHEPGPVTGRPLSTCCLCSRLILLTDPSGPGKEPVQPDTATRHPTVPGGSLVRPSPGSQLSCDSDADPRTVPRAQTRARVISTGLHRGRASNGKPEPERFLTGDHNHSPPPFRIGPSIPPGWPAAPSDESERPGPLPPVRPTGARRNNNRCHDPGGREG